MSDDNKQRRAATSELSPVLRFRLAASLSTPLTCAMPQANRWELLFRNAPLQPGDEQEGAWPRERLLQMDERFTTRVQRAIQRGEEHAHAMRRNEK